MAMFMFHNYINIYFDYLNKLDERNMAEFAYQKELDTMKFKKTCQELSANTDKESWSYTDCLREIGVHPEQVMDNKLL